MSTKKSFSKSRTFAGQEQDELIQKRNDKSGYEKLLSCCGGFWACWRMWCPCICCCCPYPFYQVNQGFVGLKQEFGRYNQLLDPGFHQINPCSDQVIPVSTKTNPVNLEGSVILTKDNITMTIDTVLYYRINDPVKANYRIQDIRGAIIEVTYAALRTICGEYMLQELLIERFKIQEDLHEMIENMIHEWGLYCEKVFIKDMKLSQELIKGLSMAGTARRETEAKIIGAKANVDAAKFQREAADMLDSGAAMQIRFLETITQISKGPSRKVVMMNL